jgi:acetoin utilization deacetylase AcuC-like enzyme
MTRALYLQHPSSLEHDTGDHPERPERIRAIEAALERRAWLGLERVPAPAVERDALEAVHPTAYVDRIEEVSNRGGGMLDLDTVASAGSFEAALHSAGGAVAAVSALLGQGAEVAFCGLRPPGHHAERERAMGFCLFNNVAVAAQDALDRLEAERVLVLDWDVHHGNGTNDIFYDTNAVLYVSIHQSPLYPGTGSLSENGSGAGEGYTVNLPVSPGAGHAEFVGLVEHVVAPVARAYAPDLLLVSAGFDAHRDDPLANCELTEESYAAMAGWMRTLSEELDAPLGFVLEGGYELRALSNSVVATLEAALAENGRDPGHVDPRAVVTSARDHYRRWWPDLE